MSSPPAKLPNWADGVGADITEPTETKKSLGWVGGTTPDRPPAQFMNYWMNKVFEWIDFFFEILVLFDLQNWFDQDSQIGADWTVHALEYASAPDLWVAVGDRGGHRVIITSPDAETWTVRDDPGSGSQKQNGITFSPTVDSGRWCSVGQGSGDESVFTAPAAGTPWTIRAIAVGTDFLQAVVWDPTNALFIAVGDGERIYSSADGITWTSENSGAGVSFRSVAHDGTGKLVAVGDSSRLATSSDGTTWAFDSIGTPFSLGSLQFVSRFNGGAGLWIAFSPTGGSRIAISTTGLTGTWTVITGHGIDGTKILGSADDPVNERLVVTTDVGTIWVWTGSADPVNGSPWRAVVSGTSEPVNDIELFDGDPINVNRYWVRGGEADTGETGGLTQIAKSANPVF
jgi:hypothetical protein